MPHIEIEVTERKQKAGRRREAPAAAGPSDIQNCQSCVIQLDGSKLRKADRNPTVDRPQDLSPLDS